jgi:Ca2+ transporting ATPase
VPADALVIECDELQTDESNITGESDYVKKSPQSDPYLLADSMVVMGKGTAIVCAVGIMT